MTREQERNFSQSLPNMERAELRVDSVDDQGTTATAQVSGTYTFNFDGRRTTSDVSFRATFERAGAGWRMTRTE
jgi:hypothetical protein